MRSFLVILFFQIVFTASPVGTANTKNVLFIVVDDLRPDLGAYGQGYVHTPNIDKLAKESLVFERAYCQQAVCAPSRNSFMTGRRPDTTKAWNFKDHFREPNVGLNWSSLPQYFKEHGYFSSGVGKLYHPNLPPMYDPPSWSDLDKFPFEYPRPSDCRDNTWCAVPSEPTPTFADANSSTILRERLRYAAKNKLPFFLGIGFHKPHLPWRFPEEFLHYYPQSADIAPAAHRLPPIGMPSVAWFQCMPQGRFKDVNVFNNISVPLPVDLQQTLRRAYYAATSFMDSLVGEVLAELETLNLANDTIVSFHADHGWQLGEHNEWCKQTNFELATRVPMMIRAPWKKESMGKSTRAFAELVDLYPTLVELAGLPPASEENLEGSSLATLFDNPDGVIKNVTLSQYPRCLKANSSSDLCAGVPREKFDYMGYSMRTDDYRYTEWVKWNGTKLKPEWDEQVGVELYSHVGDMGNDFDAFENENIASKEPDLVKKLSEQLHQIFQKN